MLRFEDLSHHQINELKSEDSCAIITNKFQYKGWFGGDKFKMTIIYIPPSQRDKNPFKYYEMTRKAPPEIYHKFQVGDFITHPLFDREHPRAL